MAKVSVIVPIYNVEVYIEQCAKSLFEQTLDDIEYIFVDDCSPDQSISILKSVLALYPKRINQCKFIIQKKNGGQHVARRIGIQEATGEYTIHCDPDDFVDKYMYEHLYNKAKEEDLDCVWCNYKVYTNSYEEVNNFAKNKTELLRLLLRGKRMGSLCNRLIKTSIVKNPSIIYPECPYSEDLLLVIQYTLLSNSIDFLNESPYIYRKHTESITSNFTNNIDFRQKMCLQASLNVYAIDEVLRKSGLYKNFEDDLIFSKFWRKISVFSEKPSVKECKYWISLYSEINNKIFSCRSLKLKYKFLALLIFLRVYPFFKRLM